MDFRVAGQQKGIELAQTAHGWLYRSRRRIATILVCTLAVWLAFRVISGSNGWIAYHKKKVEYQQLQQEVQRLQKENEQLDQRVKALKSDPKTIEKEAREQFGYAKPGEVIYVLPEKKPATTQTPQTGVAQKTGKP